MYIIRNFTHTEYFKWIKFFLISDPFRAEFSFRTAIISADYVISRFLRNLRFIHSLARAVSSFTEIPSFWQARSLRSNETVGLVRGLYNVESFLHILRACSFSRLALPLQLLTQGCSRLGLVAGSSSRRLVVARIAREPYAACNINFALLFPPVKSGAWLYTPSRELYRRSKDLSHVHVGIALVETIAVRNPDRPRSSSRNYAVKRISAPRDRKEPSQVSYLGHLHLLLPFGAVLLGTRPTFTVIFDVTAIRSISQT